jgi:hypothetical protein
MSVTYADYFTAHQIKEDYILIIFTLEAHREEEINPKNTA